MPASGLRSGLVRLTDMIYRAAVRVDTFLLHNLLGLQLELEGESHFPAGAVVTSNHQTWFDILILQWLITRNGPMIKFLIKRQLIYVPIVGWICLALGFPRLYRRRDEASRTADYRAIQAAATEMQHHAGVLLIFAEGTRFTAKKHQTANSPYQSLLPPKPGGMSILHQALPGETVLVDISIDYGSRAGASFWAHLNGRTRRVKVKISHHTFNEIADVPTFLHSCWERKDVWLRRNNQ